MRLTMREKKALVKATASRYRRSSKKEKKKILDEFVESTGYNRSYASLILSKFGKGVRNGELRIVGDIARTGGRRRERYYDDKVLAALRRVWTILDWICGKRLAAAIPEVVPVLERVREIRLDKHTKEKLLKISAASIDRLLAADRKKLQIKGRSHTKPGSLLKGQIPIRRFDEWNEGKPGFVEIDLVGHDGGNSSGEFCFTLDVTDIFTAWTETRAVKNKAQVWVFKALVYIRKSMPFSMLGIDSDNGSEFLNAHLVRYCQQEKITFTRARPYRKNDNCHVEERNNAIVRRAVGYHRYDTDDQLKTLNELYSLLRLYTNYFQPVMKLVRKERVGSRVKKIYDKPQTPYHRVLASADVSDLQKRKLRNEYADLNPAQLKRDISALQEKLAASGRRTERKRA
jgi:hypothetical protein